MVFGFGKTSGGATTDATAYVPQADVATDANYAATTAYAAPVDDAGYAMQPPVNPYGAQDPALMTTGYPAQPNPYAQPEYAAAPAVPPSPYTDPYAGAPDMTTTSYGAPVTTTTAQPEYTTSYQETSYQAPQESALPPSPFGNYATTTDAYASQTTAYHDPNQAFAATTTGYEATTTTTTTSYVQEPVEQAVSAFAAASAALAKEEEEEEIQDVSPESSGYVSSPYGSFSQKQDVFGDTDDYADNAGSTNPSDLMRGSYTADDEVVEEVSSSAYAPAAPISPFAMSVPSEPASEHAMVNKYDENQLAYVPVMTQSPIADSQQAAQSVYEEVPSTEHVPVAYEETNVAEEEHSEELSADEVEALVAHSFNAAQEVVSPFSNYTQEPHVEHEVVEETAHEVPSDLYAAPAEEVASVYEEEVIAEEVVSEELAQEEIHVAEVVEEEPVDEAPEAIYAHVEEDIVTPVEVLSDEVHEDDAEYDVTAETLVADAIVPEEIIEDVHDDVESEETLVAEQHVSAYHDSETSHQDENVETIHEEPVLVAAPASVEHAVHASDAVAVAGFVETFDRLTRLITSRCDELEKRMHESVSSVVPLVEAVTHANSKAIRVGAGDASIIKLGVIESLLSDPKVTDIMINGAHNVFVERGGLMTKTDIEFPDNQVLLDIAQQIAEFSGRTLDSDNPIVDARLPDGSRVNIIVPPLALDGVVISIRKFGGASITLDTMVGSGVLSQMAADFLKIAAKSKVNIIVSGGTGTGKTTLLNSISRFIGDSERIVTIEDSAELQLQQPHVVRLEASQAKKGDDGSSIGIRELVKNALRMRPERILVGESRGAEAFDMIQAMNTGHDGSFTTIHANTPRDAVGRLENMIGMANLGLPLTAIRKQIATAVHIIIQTTRMDDGSRRITHISEIVGMEGEILTMQDLFTLQLKQDANGNQVGGLVWANVFPRHKVLNQLVREANILKMGG